MSNHPITLFFVLYTSSFLIALAKGQNCVPNNPILTRSPLVCIDINNTLPEFTKAVSVMKCVNCNIPVLDENSITNFQGETLNLSFSHVQTIALSVLKSFTRQENVHKFLLHDNEITSIAPKVFSGFTKLDEINIRNSNISELDNGVFDSTNITILDLSLNHITNIKQMFSGLRVNVLNLSSNNIGEIEDDAFDNTTFWTTTGLLWRNGEKLLDLSWNIIHKLKPGVFKASTPPSTLQILNLQGNRIKTIENDTFLQLAYLSVLLLEDNCLTELHIHSFRGLSHLKTLVLKGNMIERIPMSMFADLLLLEHLDLSKNKLQTLNGYTFSGLAYLTKLNISHNYLKVLDELHLLPLGRLINLDISNTRLKRLNLSSIFQHNNRLRVVTINDNFWMCKDLVQMFKLLNKRIDGFSFPSHHYDVPNLHGIACSPTEFEVDANTFDDFLGIISHQVFEELYDSRLENEYMDLNTMDVLQLIKSINGMFYMILIIMLIIMILFLQFIARYICHCLYTRHILSDTLSCKDTPNPGNMELI